MRRAQPDDLHEDAVPIMVLKVSEPRLQRLFPVPLTEADALSEAEPSKGALALLDGGGLVLIMYGMVTSRATISFPATTDARGQIRKLLRESSIQADDVEWVRDDLQLTFDMLLASAPRRAAGVAARGGRVTIPTLRDLSTDELRARERELRVQLFKLRFQRATRGVQNPFKIREYKREIAEIKALLTSGTKQQGSKQGG